MPRQRLEIFAEGEPDFLTANDQWFMPVSQKTGPDGSLCVLDWYDRYHCYQDALRDTPGLDRQQGRIYRVRYQDTPRNEPFDKGELAEKMLEATLPAIEQRSGGRFHFDVKNFNRTIGAR